jgi:cell fate regulator YaaT (PSP1 superfamily)
MMKNTEITETTPRDRFIRAAEKEMAKFERREIEFRQKDRQERAAELNIYACHRNLARTT